MTKQQAFNKIWKTFVTNRAPKCSSKLRSCSYGGLNQAGCAVGCLLHKKDRIAAFAWERGGIAGDTSIGSLKREFPKIKSYLPVEGGFLKRMQEWHDNDMTPIIQERKEQLRKIAKAYKLTAPAK